MCVPLLFADGNMPQKLFFPADYDDGTNGHNFTQTILKKILNERAVNGNGMPEVLLHPSNIEITGFSSGRLG